MEPPRTSADRLGRGVDSPKGGPPWRRRLTAGAIFLVLLGLYHLNGDYSISNDAKPNMYLALNLLKQGRMTFTSQQMPFMFVWHLDGPGGSRLIQFLRWDEDLGGRTADQLRRAGLLGQPVPRYYVVPSVRTDAATGLPSYVNTFGPGAGLAVVPLFAALEAAGENLPDNPRLMNYAGKFVAAAMVAASAALIFLTAAGFASLPAAALVAAAYGLGTCVWTVSSQSLWQHGPNEFFVALGTLFLLRIGGGRGRWRDAAFCGLAYSAAVVCRPTSVVVAAVAGAYLLIVSRRLVIPYVLAALPLGLALGAYNTYYLGSPFETGQGRAGHVVAMQKTDKPDLWQTPLAEGAAGLMLSPSRGLLVFSPWVVFAIGGAVAAWRRRGAYAPLTALTVATVVLWVVAFKWFDWWGGWCFGYRPIVDTMPLLAVMLIPAAGWICRRKARMGVFLFLLAWSVVVQVLGAWAYNIDTWNAPTWSVAVHFTDGSPPVTVANMHQVKQVAATRPVEGVEPILGDIDKPEYRHRLWSVADSQLAHLLTRFAESRAVKRQEMEEWLTNP